MRSAPWWKEATIYQIYPRSFFDSNGDGEGDLPGITSQLDYVKNLGVDAIWLSPFYTSPNKDGGYDVANPRDVDPRFGNLDDAKELIAQAHKRELRVIADIVPNHFSDQHAWFQAALKAGRGSKERERFHFYDANEDGTAPNNWISLFGGPSWTQVADGQFYLHLFDSSQPDLNWDNPEVNEDFEKTLRFWIDLGVDGFRIDVAHGLVKEDVLKNHPDPQGLSNALRLDVAMDSEVRNALLLTVPYFDRQGVHEIYRKWRKLFDSYGEREIMAVAEAWVHPATRIARYLRPGELMNSFNFEFLGSKWDVNEIKTNINKSIEALSEVGAPSSWVFNNHDVVRSVDRFDLGLGLSGGTTLERQGDRSKFNLQRGRKRAKAGALLMFALPGGAYVYQGEELTLPEARDIPEDRLSDPRWKMSDYTDRGRDGCRVPLPWKKDSKGAFGFSNNSKLTPNDSWLPQSDNWGEFSVELQENDPTSSLNLYRKALEIRKSQSGLGDGPMSWVDAGSDVVAFSRPGNFYCYLNLGEPIELPKNINILVSSSPIEDGKLPTDTAIWFIGN